MRVAATSLCQFNHLWRAQWKSYEGKGAVVTGAASGIGKAIVSAFMEAGASALICDLNAKALGDTARELGIRAIGRDGIQADIERQFEFVQREWMKGGEFIGLDPNEQDPIYGVGGEDSQMIVPGSKTVPVRHSYLRQSQRWRVSVRSRAEGPQGYHRKEILRLPEGEEHHVRPFQWTRCNRRSISRHH
jgi:hypothetical protein